MYLGHAVEQGPKERIFARPLHPYTQALLASTPGIAAVKRKRIVLKGELPSPLDPPKGCVFSTRCPYVTDRCRVERPPLRPLDARLVACHYADASSSARRRDSRRSRIRVWTAAWTDPKEQLVGVLMTQAPGPSRPYYRRMLRALTYQAIVD